MFANNPFAELAASVPPAVMQWYVILMIICVVGGTLYDVWHKQSAKYFFDNWRASRAEAKQPGGNVGSLAVKTLTSEVLTSSEFCNPNRRIAHLLTMYGFIVYVVTTIIMVFGYPTSAAATPAIWPILWHLGALSVCIGGYWFWFFIRADVSAEGQSPFRIIRADLFILSLLASVTLALIWSFLQPSASTWANIALGLYLLATTVLFGSVPWSKFSHMFFKPAAALEKRVAEADGTRRNLPRPADRTLAADRERHSMELLKDAPLDMGLGIKREEPRHY
ncbi:MAG: hypothetical protein ACR2PI_00730 [Hyphomicrobiaceae bacterium]